MGRSLVPGDRLVLTNLSGAQPIEEITVLGIETDHEHLKLRFAQPIQNETWDMETKMHKLGRSFRLFGCNAPPRYPDVELYASGVIKQWKYVSIDNSSSGGANGYALSGGDELHLDSRYQDLKPGTRLLLVDGANQQTILTITSVDQIEAQLGILNDTVTRIKVFPNFSAISDRRHVVLYELPGPPALFWGFSYPDQIESASVLIPGQRIDAQTIEIARPVKRYLFQEGFTVNLKEIITGRKVILKDETEKPIAAKIIRATITGREIIFNTTVDDVETLYLLLFDPDNRKTVNGLCSTSLDPFHALTHPAPSLDVTIGAIGPRSITLSGAVDTLDHAAASLQTALRAVDTDPVFSQAVVLKLDHCLVVLAGDFESSILFSKNANDETTIVELGLDKNSSQALTGLMSGEIDPVPVYTKAFPQLSVRVGALATINIDLDLGAATLEDISEDIQSKLNAADISPFFKYARVTTIDKRILVFPGMVGAAYQAYLKIELQTDEEISLDRASTALLGNVAQASHGETISSEVLGDGDPALVFQKFELKKHPVTFVPSSGRAGAENTLRLSVNNALWKEVDSLFGQGPKDKVYRTRINDAAEMTVCFGDGVTGARPFKGRANITATYRQGIGVQGRVRAGQLKTLLDKPKGLKATINPSDADGGADPETLDSARENAPATVRTFDRAVSLPDLEDLARSRNEIAKAKVTWVWSGESRAAHLTVAGQNGSTFSASALAQIHAGLTAQRDPNRQLLLDNYTTIPIVITATLIVDDTHVADRVADAARVVLLDALSFQTLAFGQSVNLSDVYAILQSVEGVIAVDIDRFMFKQQTDITNIEFNEFLDDRGVSRSIDNTPRPVQNHLWIFSARPNTASKNPLVFPAEQASVESPSQDITILTMGGLPG